MIYFDKGYIGCFEMNDKDSGRRQLEEYVRQLTHAGHKRIIAPINGDTWHTYRLMSWSADAPAFPFEPQNPLWYNDVYTALGFKPLKTYRSDAFSIDAALSSCPKTGLSFRKDGDQPLETANISSAETAFSFRKDGDHQHDNNSHMHHHTGLSSCKDSAPTLETAKISSAETTLSFRNYHDGDLKLIYDISLQGFDTNFLYDDITFEAFSGLYEPILPMIDKKLVIIAEADHVPMGFMFSFAVGNQLILKTMAILPEYRSKGIGAKMFHHILLAGQQKGLRTAIAALMAEGNNSHKIASKYGSEKIREYTLYCLDT